MSENPYQPPKTPITAAQSLRAILFPLTIAFLLGFAAGAAVVAIGAGIFSAALIEAMGK
jgi:hypothetical protein